MAEELVYLNLKSQLETFLQVEARSNLESWNEHLSHSCFAVRCGIVSRFIMGSLKGRLCSLRSWGFGGKELVLCHLLVLTNTG